MSYCICGLNMCIKCYYLHFDFGRFIFLNYYSILLVLVNKKQHSKHTLKTTKTRIFREKYTNIFEKRTYSPVISRYFLLCARFGAIQ